VSGLRGGNGGARPCFLGDVGEVCKLSFLPVNCVGAGLVERGGRDEGPSG
jgi:hypothetical protein